MNEEVKKILASTEVKVTKPVRAVFSGSKWKIAFPDGTTESASSRAEAEKKIRLWAFAQTGDKAVGITHVQWVS